ncbi:MAG: hypothetical protein H6700_08920 [Myxococcales bacterium]|nr:hypothetical protein [Myxococcales bacterium]MCB9531873.1 hypothetical protein [Myxococcales bacterium]
MNGVTARSVRACAAALVLSLPAVCFAGPWVHDPGTGFAKLGLSAFDASDGMRDGVSTGLAYRSTTADLYAEVGLPGRLQVSVNAAWVAATNHSELSNIRYRNRSIGDLRLAVDHAPLRHFPFTVGIEAKLPVYADPSDQAHADGLPNDLFDPAQFPVVGDDNVDLMPRLQIGHSFYPRRIWAQGAVGYLWRGCSQHVSGPCADFRDGVVVSAGVGAQPVADILTTELFAKATINTQPLEGDTLATAQTLYVQAKVGIGHPHLGGVGLALSVGGIPYADAAARGYDVGAGITYEF